MIAIPYDDAPPSDVAAARRERKAAVAAESWRHDPALEAADELRRTDPASYAALPPTVKIALGHYATAKKLATTRGTA